MSLGVDDAPTVRPAGRYRASAERGEGAALSWIMSSSPSLSRQQDPTALCTVKTWPGVLITVPPAVNPPPSRLQRGLPSKSNQPLPPRLNSLSCHSCMMIKGPGRDGRAAKGKRRVHGGRGVIGYTVTGGRRHGLSPHAGDLIYVQICG